MPEVKDNRASAIVAELLEEQQLLTAVARFSQKHERTEAPLQSRYYRDLIPLDKPKAGEQYAFEVDLDKCSGCKACVAACHSLNGLEDDESWRSVGLLVSQEQERSFQQSVTTACHHCVDPACLNGCPVKAYEKNPLTGIVHHLDDQCIGCQYCVFKCPYEVPRYSARLGIVRKCDMCSGRLEAGEAPACVQSCPNQAIRITKVSVAEVRARNEFLPASPAPSYTLPTTTFHSARGLPENLSAADGEHIRPAEAHWPLVWMLALTQAGAGLFWCESWRRLAGLAGDGAALRVAAVGTAFVIGGMAIGVMHLGRPLQAWRAFIGVGRSWLSREIVMFGAFASCVLLVLACEVLPLSFPGLPLPAPPWHIGSVAGALAVLASVMVYHDTPREFWSGRRSGAQFFGSALILGLAGSLVLNRDAEWVPLPLCLTGVLKLFIFLGLLTHSTPAGSAALKRSAILLMRDLAGWSLARMALLVAGGIVLPAGFFLNESVPGAAGSLLMFVIVLAGEIIERSLFFRAVSQPKMPGGLP